jgi:TolA-binding protein
MYRVLMPLGAAVLALAALAEVNPSAQGGEDLARRQYDSGLAFVQNGRYAEALKDFQAVVDSFPKSAVADDALLQIAQYQLDVAHDQDAAQTAADRLLKEYASSDSAPMAYVLNGRLTIARSRAAADVETALASFERVPRLFPGSPAVAAARYYAGDTLRLARRTDDALQQLLRVTLEYPQSIWAARADLASAINMVAAGRATQALGRLQRIRQQFPGSPEAARALDFNTIIYRLYMRKPAYAFSGRYIGGDRDRFRDVVGLSIDGAGRILLGHKLGVAIFKPDGTAARQVGASDASAFVSDGDRVVIARRDVLVAEGTAPIAIMVPVAGKPARQVEEIASIVALSGGDWVVADRKAKTVVRTTSAGNFVANFASVNAARLARDEFDDVAMIDRESKAIVIADRDGKVLSRIPAKGTGYELDDPADVAFDGLGHLYVLDARRAAVHVFGPANRLIASIAAPGKDAGSLQKPKALAVDAAGRVYVFDDGSQRIQVYQ